MNCAASDGATVVVGDTKGVLHYYLVQDRQEHVVELLPTSSEWTVDVDTAPITALEIVADRWSEGLQRSQPLVVVGTDSGDVAFYRDAIEIRRMRIEAGVTCIRHTWNQKFIVGDCAGNVYGVDPYNVLWKTSLNAHGRNEKSATYPKKTHSRTTSITSVSISDVEHTRSSYVLLASGDKNVTLLHYERQLIQIPLATPIRTVLSIPHPAKEQNGQSDLVLAAGNDGMVYQLFDAHTEDGRVYARVEFPIQWLLQLPLESDKASWMAVSSSGQAAIFHGADLVKELELTKAGGTVDSCCVLSSETGLYLGSIQSDRLYLQRI